MTIASLNEFKKVAAELSTISDDKLIETPTYLRQKLLQKMLIVLNAINEK